MDQADGRARVEDGRGGRQPPRDRWLLDRVPIHDHPLLVWRRIADDDLHHETVDLRFGQAVRALVLDRVLRRENREELGERMRLPADRHLAFLHRFEECALHFGGRAVDLVGEQEIGEDRAQAGAEALGRGVVDHRPVQVGR